MRKIRKGLLLGVSFFLFCAVASAQNMVTVPEEIVAYPDMIIHNGMVVTMDDTSFGLNTSRGTTAEAIAIRGDKIQAIGNNARILSLAGPGTDRINAKGRMVMPGIIDAHTHIHNNELNYWVSQNPEILESLAASFSVAGLTDEELEQGIRLGIQQHVGSTTSGPMGVYYRWQPGRRRNESRRAVSGECKVHDGDDRPIGPEPPDHALLSPLLRDEHGGHAGNGRSLRLKIRPPGGGTR